MCDQWIQTFTNKFLARLEDHSLSPDNYLRLKVPTVTQYEMSLLHCDVAEKTALTYIFFFFQPLTLFQSANRSPWQLNTSSLLCVNISYIIISNSFIFKWKYQYTILNKMIIMKHVCACAVCDTSVPVSYGMFLIISYRGTFPISPPLV